MERIMQMRIRRLIPTLAVFACLVGVTMPISAAAQSFPPYRCEISGGGTLYNGDTFMINNFHLENDGTVRMAPRPLVMYLTNERPREAFMGSPDAFTCHINGVRAFSVYGNGHFRGAPAEFCITNAQDRHIFIDSFNIKITVPDFDTTGGCDGETLYEYDSDLSDGDIEVTEPE